ncbi:MAG: LamG domain-containing protein [Nitrosopumilus sp.]|nr:LamG domain-containing protein [Nitrosopumilus sp.]
MLFPITLFTLIRFDSNILNSESLSVNAQRFFSLCFILILLSPVGVMPFYASSSWGLAFAQEISNQTLSEPSADLVANATDTGTSTNATDTGTSTNATDTGPPIDVTDTLPTNSTDTEPLVEPIIETIDLLSLSQQNSTNSSEIISENSTDNTNELYIDGTEDFVTITDTTLNEIVDKVTFSTWVLPEYDGASAELTILSKENSFVLSINNVIPPPHTVKFSIFDGITWTEISGDMQIDSISHIAAVKNGSSISLYVNGTSQGQISLPDTFEMSEGQLDYAVSGDIAQSDADIVIGAYVNTLRGSPESSNLFSGMLDDVVIYKTALSQLEIQEIYNNYMLDYTLHTVNVPTVELLNLDVPVHNVTSTLVHDEIEIGKPVTWTQTITLDSTENLEDLIVEIPDDAENLVIST